MTSNDALTLIRAQVESNRLRAAQIMLDLCRARCAFNVEAGAPTFGECRELMREVWAMLKEFDHVQRIPVRLEVETDSTDYGVARGERG